MADSNAPFARDWAVSWEASRIACLESARAATPAQRLAWLEDALRLAHRAGALGPAGAGALRVPPRTPE